VPKFGDNQIQMIMALAHGGLDAFSIDAIFKNSKATQLSSSNEI
jgi:uncharacterized membrane protein YwzB